MKEFKLIEDYDSLESLLESEHDLGNHDLSGELDVARFLRDDALPAEMPRPLDFRLGVMDRIGTQRRRRLVWSSGLVALAASLLLAFLLVPPLSDSDTQTVQNIERPLLRPPVVASLAPDRPDKMVVTNQFITNMLAYQKACINESALLSPRPDWSSSLLADLSKQPGRTIVQLYTSRFSAKQIAQVFHCATASLQVTLSYTLRNLKHYLARQGNPEGTP